MPVKRIKVRLKTENKPVQKLTEEELELLRILLEDVGYIARVYNKFGPGLLDKLYRIEGVITDGR